jgi:sporulation protein YlmC with PRC-barrel domain
MVKQEIHVELLIGKRVSALNGRSIGRLEEIRAEEIRGQYYVKEFLVGSYAGLERLAALTIGRAILRVFGVEKKNGGYRVPWDKLDLSDPKRPRLVCTVNELPLINNQD